MTHRLVSRAHLRPHLTAAAAVVLAAGIVTGPPPRASAAVSTPATRGLASGMVVGWGAQNYDYAQSPPPGLTAVTSIAAGDGFSLAAKSDGTVVGWGQGDGGQTTPPPGLTGVVQVAANYAYSLALKSDGTVIAWGVDWYNELAVPAGLNHVVSIAAGYRFGLALKSDGTVVAWGDDTYGATDLPPGLHDVVAVAAGYSFGLALKSDGTVIGWGQNDHGQATPPAGLRRIKAISASAGYGLALRSNGTVAGWGQNNYGQAAPPAGLTGVTAISAGVFSGLALKADGTVTQWGRGDGFIPPVWLHDVTAISSGGFQALALVPRGTSGPITTVAPNTRATNSPRHVIRIRTAGLQPGASVAFSGFDGTGLTIGKPTVVSSGLLTVEVTVAPGTREGPRDITITNPDGSQAGCESCFTVSAAPSIISVTGGPLTRGAHGAQLSVSVDNAQRGMAAATWVPGVTITSVTFVNDYQLTITVDVAADAAAHRGALWLYNPDGGWTERYGAVVVR